MLNMVTPFHTKLSNEMANAILSLNLIDYFRFQSIHLKFSIYVAKTFLGMNYENQTRVFSGSPKIAS